MNINNQTLSSELQARGAVLVGFGDLGALPADVREGLPVGVSVAVKYPKDVIRGIAELPTKEYFEWYNRLNEKLDELVAYGVDFIILHGYRAVALTRAYLSSGASGITSGGAPGSSASNDAAYRMTGGGVPDYGIKLPHKTVATRAGIGWIGKCALLVTKEYGSMVRLSSILTDAPFECAAPVDTSLCGDCSACADACPAKAVSGKHWYAGLARDEFFNAAACGAAARERSMQGFGGGATICGKCIEVCPFTRIYMNS